MAVIARSAEFACRGQVKVVLTEHEVVAVQVRNERSPTTAVRLFCPVSDDSPRYPRTASLFVALRKQLLLLDHLRCRVGQTIPRRHLRTPTRPSSGRH